MLVLHQGNTAQLRRRASGYLFRQFCVLKRLKYEVRITAYSCFNGRMEFDAQTYGEHVITVHAKQAVEVRINNTEEVLLPDEQGYIKIVLSESRTHICVRLI